MSQTKFNFLDQDECDQVQSNIVRNQHQTTQRIAKAWHIFATTNKLKHNTQKRRDAQFTFISGAVATLPEVPMLISLCLASGRDLESVIERWKHATRLLRLNLPRVGYTELVIKNT